MATFRVHWETVKGRRVRSSSTIEAPAAQDAVDRFDALWRGQREIMDVWQRVVEWRKPPPAEE